MVVKLYSNLRRIRSEQSLLEVEDTDYECRPVDFDDEIYAYPAPVLKKFECSPTELSESDESISTVLDEKLKQLEDDEYSIDWDTEEEEPTVVQQEEYVQLEPIKEESEPFIPILEKEQPPIVHPEPVHPCRRKPYKKFGMKSNPCYNEFYLNEGGLQLLSNLFQDYQCGPDAGPIQYRRKMLCRRRMQCDCYFCQQLHLQDNQHEECLLGPIVQLS